MRVIGAFAMKTRIGYLITAYASLFCYGLLDNSRGPAYPYILGQFDLTNAQGSQVFAISTLAGLISISFGRVWLRKIGELSGQRIWTILIFVSTITTGLSAYVAGYPLLIASAFFFGLGLGGTTLSTNLLVAYGSTEHSRRRIFSGLHSMYGIASVIAPAAFALSIRSGLMWGASFIILSSTCLVPLIASFATKQVRHEYDMSERPTDLTRWQILKVGFVMAFYVSSEVAISSRFVLYASTRLPMDPADANFYLSLFFALLLAGRLAMFIFPLKHGTYKLMLASTTSSIILIVLGIIVHPIFMSLAGLTMSIYFPCGMEWISMRFGRNSGYMMTWVMISIATVLILMHWGIGIAADIIGVTNAMFLSPILLLGAVISLISNRSEFEKKG